MPTTTQHNREDKTDDKKEGKKEEKPVEKKEAKTEGNNKEDKAQAHTHKMVKLKTDDRFGKFPDLMGGQLFHERWQVIKQLGKGATSQVWEVRRAPTKSQHKSIMASPTPAPGGKSDHFALKIECRFKNAQNESTVLKRLNKHSRNVHVPRYYAAKECDPNYCYIIMQLTGDNLEEVRKKLPNKRMSISSSVRVALQALDAIQHIHRMGYVHRDIKPANFTLGLKDPRRIYMIDYGTARVYVDDLAKVNSATPADQVALRRERLQAPFRGTYRYCSPWLHENREACRRDDLISMVYMVVNMCAGRLPWTGCRKKEVIHTMKKNSTVIKDMFADQLCPNELAVIYQSLAALDFQTTPDYKMIRSCLQSVQTRNNCSENSPYDWETPNSADPKSHTVTLTTTSRSILLQQTTTKTIQQTTTKI